MFSAPRYFYYEEEALTFIWTALPCAGTMSSSSEFCNDRHMKCCEKSKEMRVALIVRFAQYFFLIAIKTSQNSGKFFFKFVRNCRNSPKDSDTTKNVIFSSWMSSSNKRVQLSANRWMSVTLVGLHIFSPLTNSRIINLSISCRCHYTLHPPSCIKCK